MSAGCDERRGIILKEGRGEEGQYCEGASVL